MPKESFNLNKKFIILLLMTVLFLLIPYGLINNFLFTGEKVEIDKQTFYYLPECSDSFSPEIINSSTKLSKTSYIDVYIIPEYKNIKCLGKIINLYVSNNDKSSNVLIGYNLKALKYLRGTFTLLLFSF